MSGILFSVEMVEGKDHPQQIKEKWSKLAYFAMGRNVVLDSGFCVLWVLIELKKVGLFASAVIKKRRFWPAMVPGDEMTEAFANANVGT